MAVELKDTCEPVGICGFVRRDSLPEAAIGFALLPQFERKGYAFESAATLLYGKERLNFNRVLAITSKHNFASGRLLEKLGFAFERFIKMTDDSKEIKLFSTAD